LHLCSGHRSSSLAARNRNVGGVECSRDGSWRDGRAAGIGCDSVVHDHLHRAGQTFDTGPLILLSQLPDTLGSVRRTDPAVIPVTPMRAWSTFSATATSFEKFSTNLSLSLLTSAMLTATVQASQPMSCAEVRTRGRTNEQQRAAARTQLEFGGHRAFLVLAASFRTSTLDDYRYGCLVACGDARRTPAQGINVKRSGR
jgi:hypothetical protein